MLAVLNALPKRLANGAVRAGLVAGAAVIRDEARERVPVQSGKLRRAIKSGSSRVMSDGTVRIKVKLLGEHSYLGLWMEYGVEPHLIARTGKGQGRVAVKKAQDGGVPINTGAMKIGEDFVSGIITHPGIRARPFMRPALDARANDAIRAIGTRMKEHIAGKTGLQAPGLEADVEE